MSKAPWIVFEGGEGSGKSTQALMLLEAIEKAGFPCLKTREPGGTPKAEKIRTLLTESQDELWDPVTELFLHVAARREHVMKLILPAINQGKWVVCDRFNPSTIAYQAFGGGLSPHYVWSIIHSAIGGIHPDMVVWLDVDIKTGLNRAHARMDTNHYETKGEEFHERVRSGYQHYRKAYPNYVFYCDSSQRDPNELHRDVIQMINTRFNQQLRPLEAKKF